MLRNGAGQNQQQHQQEKNEQPTKVFQNRRANKENVQCLLTVQEIITKPSPMAYTEHKRDLNDDFLVWVFLAKINS